MIKEVKYYICTKCGMQYNKERTRCICESNTSYTTINTPGLGPYYPIYTKTY